MKLRDFPLLADQNIHSDVVAFLRAKGFDIVATAEAKLSSGTDAQILTHAMSESRLVVTHDADFGTLAIAKGTPVTGIVYLRPGHVGPQLTIDTIRQLLLVDPDLTAPFLLVAKRSGSRVRIRVRSLAPPAGGTP